MQRRNRNGLIFFFALFIFVYCLLLGAFWHIGNLSTVKVPMSERVFATAVFSTLIFFMAYVILRLKRERIE